MNKRRKRNMALLPLAAIVILLLGGCSLADRNLQTGSKGDHLCGVYVTVESEVEALDETLQSLRRDHEKYYARENGADREQPYSFTGLKGIYGFIIYEKDSICSASSPAMREGFEMQVKAGQGEEISGTLYYASGQDTAFFCYPIRKNAEGYYLSERTSAGFSGDSGLGFNESESWTDIVGGEKTEKEFKYNLTFEVAAPVKTAAVKEMNGKDQVIRTTNIDFKKGDFTLKLRPQTSYLIVEENVAEEGGKEAVKRSLYDRETIKKQANDEEEMLHYSYFKNGSGFLLPKVTRFVI